MVTIVTGLISILTNAWLSAGSVQQACGRRSSAFDFVLGLCGVRRSPVRALLRRGSRPCGVLQRTAAVFGHSAFSGSAACSPRRAFGTTRFSSVSYAYVALSVIEAVSLSVSTIVGVAMALGGYGYWAIVGATVVLPACNTVCLWIATRWIPGMPHRGADIRSTLGFGGLITLNILVVYVAYNLDKVLIGRFWGAEALGIYGRAYQLATIPPENINAAIGGVAFSALSRLQDNPPRFKRYFLKSYSLVMSITIPSPYRTDIAISCSGRNGAARGNCFAY